MQNAQDKDCQWGAASIATAQGKFQCAHVPTLAYQGTMYDQLQFCSGSRGVHLRGVLTIACVVYRAL